MVCVVSLLLASCAFAQGSSLGPAIDYRRPPHTDSTMEELLAARAKLIHRYAGKLARGVAVCGYEDMISGEDYTYLTIYVYPESTAAFMADFNKFGTQNAGGSIGVDGVTVSIQVIQRQKKKV